MRSLLTFCPILAPGMLSLETKRILRAARLLSYRESFVARSPPPAYRCSHKCGLRARRHGVGRRRGAAHAGIYIAAAALSTSSCGLSTAAPERTGGPAGRRPHLRRQESTARAGAARARAALRRRQLRVRGRGGAGNAPRDSSRRARARPAGLGTWRATCAPPGSAVRRRRVSG